MTDQSVTLEMMFKVICRENQINDETTQRVIWLALISAYGAGWDEAMRDKEKDEDTDEDKKVV